MKETSRDKCAHHVSPYAYGNEGYWCEECQRYLSLAEAFMHYEKFPKEERSRNDD